MKERLCGINEDQGRLCARWTLAHSQLSEVKAYCILLLNFLQLFLYFCLKFSRVLLFCRWLSRRRDFCFTSLAIVLSLFFPRYRWILKSRILLCGTESR